MYPFLNFSLDQVYEHYILILGLLISQNTLKKNVLGNFFLSAKYWVE